MLRQTYSNGQIVYSVYMMHKYVNENKLHIYNISLTRFKYTQNWKIWGDWNDPYGDQNRWSINDVLKDPNKYKRDYKNILKAKLSYPIICVYTPLDLFIIVDGYHRYAKSILQKKKTIKSYVFTDPKIIKKFKLGKQTKSIWKKIDKMKQKDFDILYKKRFVK